MVYFINSVPKYVVSTTLEEPLEWSNSTLIEGAVAQEIARLSHRAETISAESVRRVCELPVARERS
jgi:hypothetical protein